MDIGTQINAKEEHPELFSEFEKATLLAHEMFEAAASKRKMARDTFWKSFRSVYPDSELFEWAFDPKTGKATAVRRKEEGE